MNIQTVVTGPYEVNCLIVSNSENKALVVDPGDNASKIIKTLNDQNLSIAAYLCTHGHVDHISALAKLYQALPAPVAMHSADWKWAFEDINQMPPYYSVPEKPESELVQLESEKEREFGGIKFQCIETPGHTPGSVCLYFPDSLNLISGDTLFKNSVGRTDLPGGDPRQLKESLQLLKELPDNVTVFPGHGPVTTIAIEKQFNYFM